MRDGVAGVCRVQSGDGMQLGYRCGTTKPTSLYPSSLHSVLHCKPTAPHWWEARLALCCAVQLNIKNLKERERWASGWLQKAEIAAATPAVQMDGGANKAGAAGPQCKACSGSGSIPCPVCSMAGQVVEL